MITCNEKELACDKLRENDYMTLQSTLLSFSFYFNFNFMFCN